MYKMELFLKFIASTGIFIVAFPVKNPAVVCYDNTENTLYSFSLLISAWRMCYL